MTDFISEWHLEGLLIGLFTFLIIGLFHPLVIKGEYYFGRPVKWAFLAGGIVFLAATLWLGRHSITLSALCGVTAFSCFWSIKEIDEQVERVRQGRFPKNPRRRYPYDGSSDRRAGEEG